MSQRRPIKVLSPEVARKIAAGEVIDRPNAIVRELMDNSVDSGASEITVEIECGGIENIRVIDNGQGMTKEDLEQVAHPHATSKITSETDLLSLSTLGFRGEALSSIAAVSRLTIASGTWKMKASMTEDHILEPSSYIEGTIVNSRSLFENFPARRIFLKKPASETKMCRTTFIEKAMPRPDIAFRLCTDGKLKSDLKSGQTLVQRFVSCLEIEGQENFFYELKSGAPDGTWNFSLVIGNTDITRTDRKDIYIFVNGRRITEYSLVQAIEYGCQGYFPNGTHPAAALFLKVKSDLVDFNIHPAKKEARFKDISAIHHGVSSTTRNFFHNFTLKTMKEDAQIPYLAELASEGNPSENEGPAVSGIYEPPARESELHDVRPDYRTDDARTSFFSSDRYKIKETRTVPLEKGYVPVFEGRKQVETLSNNHVKSERNDYEPEPDRSSESITGNVKDSIFFPKKQEYFKYLGCTLGTFILAEKNGAIYIIDQHAAHERKLYDEILHEKAIKQELLVPLKLATQSDDEDKYMETLLPALNKAGFSAKKDGDDGWIFTSINSRWNGSQSDLYNAIFEKHLAPEEIIARIAASTACKAAVKDGWKLDDEAAEKLAREALNLPDPHCPHGRPVYTILTREKLFELVKRT